MTFLNAYIQGDWSGGPVLTSMDQNPNPELVENYQNFLDQLYNLGINNTATWHFEAKGVQQEKKKMTDVVRNTRQINQADCVISLLVRQKPSHLHWGSLALMAYAVGLGKPCYLIAKPDCIIWESHFVYHPLIKRFHTVQEFLDHFEKK